MDAWMNVLWRCAVAWRCDALSVQRPPQPPGPGGGGGGGGGGSARLGHRWFLCGGSTQQGYAQLAALASTSAIALV
jgi:alkanesulfonate monooxygenase SsuD/methylene tetrahydromethanopterin reductase-like flavin-dependent oxidoreductase (luciferase family)